MSTYSDCLTYVPKKYLLKHANADPGGVICLLKPRSPRNPATPAGVEPYLIRNSSINMQSRWGCLAENLMRRRDLKV